MVKRQTAACRNAKELRDRPAKVHKVFEHGPGRHHSNGTALNRVAANVLNDVSEWRIAEPTCEVAGPQRRSIESKNPVHELLARNLRESPTVRIRCAGCEQIVKRFGRACLI